MEPEMLRGYMTRSTQVQNLSSSDAQVRYFGEAIDAGRRLEPITFKKGPFFEVFLERLQATSTAMHAIDPALTPDYLTPMLYQDADIISRVQALDEGQAYNLDRVASAHRWGLQEIGATVVAPVLGGQVIPQGLLGRPPICKMGDSLGQAAGSVLCFNACFRMIFGAVTGWLPNEEALGMAILERNGNMLGHDADYLNIFRTPEFEKRVRVASFIGADLQMVFKVAQKLQAAQPSAKLFTILNIGSDYANPSGRWHTNILVSAGPGHVICFDPRPDKPTGRSVIPKVRFAERWAATQNRGHFVIISDPKKETPLCKEESQLANY